MRPYLLTMLSSDFFHLWRPQFYDIVVYVSCSILYLIASLRHCFTSNPKYSSGYAIGVENSLADMLVQNTKFKETVFRNLDISTKHHDRKAIISLRIIWTAEHRFQFTLTKIMVLSENSYNPNWQRMKTDWKLNHKGLI